MRCVKNQNFPYFCKNLPIIQEPITVEKTSAISFRRIFWIRIYFLGKDTLNTIVAVLFSYPCNNLFSYLCNNTISLFHFQKDLFFYFACIVYLNPVLQFNTIPLTYRFDPCFSFGLNLDDQQYNWNLHRYLYLLSIVKKNVITNKLNWINPLYCWFNWVDQSDVTLHIFIRINNIILKKRTRPIWKKWEMFGL